MSDYKLDEQGPQPYTIKWSRTDNGEELSLLLLEDDSFVVLLGNRSLYEGKSIREAIVVYDAIYWEGTEELF